MIDHIWQDVVFDNESLPYTRLSLGARVRATERPVAVGKYVYRCIACKTVSVNHEHYKEREYICCPGLYGGKVGLRLALIGYNIPSLYPIDAQYFIFRGNQEHSSQLLYVSLSRQSLEG